jgi:alkane 1-monooxygenase
MGRHSYHHRRPASSYESLEFVSGAPELPAGYAGSILLALFPPFWRRIMDGEVKRLRNEQFGGARLAA